MDKTGQNINIQSVNINELLEQILKRLKPIADKKNVEIVMESFRPVSAEIDETKFSLAISNLVENAIKYNHDNGWVHVSLNGGPQVFLYQGEDSGIGIPEEDQAHIFERFYRVDKSHSREIGEPVWDLPLRGTPCSCTGDLSESTAQKGREPHLRSGSRSPTWRHRKNG